ncbi:hypothetical protein PanNE5_03520 [Pandoraea sp. NE5]|uniref:hypothetical protein n=1 Tax=Pandoraea sp. NE5 TaxID=2904129 RepID=UPI0021C33EBA|nr:hypothetical protein [Pandoraea sp. NE5]BDD90912.1 hypothetical protein PanNE5_03520 [Pandoraea sp. NE5]
MLRVKDLPGKITVAEMRRLFEASITSTPMFKDNTPLGIMQVNGEFSHYMTPDTDTMWLGFALGMRCAERVDAKDRS